MKNTSPKPVPVTVRLVHDLEEKANLCAYIVDSNGKIVEHALFANNKADLRSTREMLHGAKVYLAQEMPKELASKANERMLQKIGAYEVVKNFAGNVLNVQRLPKVIFNPLWFGNCLITGHVNKDFNIDGQIRNLPICNARVHICEVETELIRPHIPIYKRKIPDWVIKDIGNLFKNIIIRPHGPGPDPGPEMKMNIPFKSLNVKKFLPERMKFQTLPPLEESVMNAMASGSVATIRQAMYDYHDVLYPYFCLWPIYWPWIYSYDEETVVPTDCNGHFEMWENTLTEDGPLNIYIWVEVYINGQWVTVYKPGVPCHTWWDYQCNTDINIKVTDSRVGPCDCGRKGPADAVWFRSIGWTASALHIEQDTNSTISLQGSTLKNGGCTDIMETQKVRPFGGGLYLKLFCGANIFDAGVTHYRWKKTMIADANQNPISGSTSIISGNVSRPYLVKLSATHYETHYVQLGAEGNGNDIAYRIPHLKVTDEPIPAADLTCSSDPSWVPYWSDMFFDSAFLDSHSLNDGIYKFELELLKKEANGSFTLVPVDKETFQISEYSDILSNRDALDIYLNINAGNSADSFKMNVRIDNTPCVADIHDAQLDTGAKSGPCGFIKYDKDNQNVHISFEASHPRNFATFSFGIVKGNGSQPTGINPAGYVLSSIGGFNLSGGLFGNDFSVLQLLNGCPGQAAFSENLNVYALATDGTDRLIYYDAYDVKAFALSNT
jgi:hypothetical protein